MSATSEYSTTSQCLSALLGRPGRVKVILDGFRWGGGNSAHVTLIRPLSGDSATLNAINTAATRGGDSDDFFSPCFVVFYLYFDFFGFFSFVFLVFFLVH